MTDHVLQSMNEVITQGYSFQHKALDIVGAGNSVDNVIAFSNGTVEIVVKDVMYTNHNTTGSATYGNYIKIRHDDGTKSLYAHLKYGSVLVTQGQYVYKGQTIGTMGATGNAYGTHLHFEIRDSNNKNLNPYDFLYGSSDNASENTISVSNQNVESSDEVNIIETSLPESSDSSSDTDVGTENESVSETSDSSSQNIILQKDDVPSKTSDDSSFSSDTSLLECDNYYGGSIVDGLKSIGVDSSFNNRSSIAAKNGISNYRGSYCQNVYLLKLLKQGKLKA